MALSEEKNKHNEGVQKPTPPSISLPKGGGAIRGIGEKFAANPVTGTGSMTVPIAASPGRAGFGPQLSLSYDSGSGNGSFGFGWNLSLPSITRKTDKGLPKYQDGDESDTFILSGAEDLVPVLESDGSRFKDDKTAPAYTIHRYRPRIEGLFARIERWTNQSDPTDVFWRSISRENITTWYGKTEKSRIADPNNPSRIFSWLICESYDDKGNAIIYEYEEENKNGVDTSQVHEKNRTDDTRSANHYLKRIKYGNKTSRLIQPDFSQMDWLFEVVFDYDDGHYEELPLDPAIPEGEQHQYIRANIEGAHNDDGRVWPVRQDPFSSYRAGFEVRTYRLCHQVLMFHHFPDELGVNDYLVRSTGFQYKESPIASFITSVTQSGFKRQGDGTYLKKSLPPLEFEYSKATIQDKVHDVDEKSLENLPQGLDGAQYQWVDIDGEGLSGILTEQGDAWFYKRNVSPLPVVGPDGQLQVVARFDPIERLATIPSLANLSGGRQQLLDLAGDGQLDVVAFDSPTPGFYERTKDEAWYTFKPFVVLPNIPWQDPNLKFVDLTGDGHADIFITEDEAFTWYLSLAETGFASGEKVRQALDEEQGPKLVFADGTQSIYLADISGDGLSDLVRIRNGEVCYWPNLGYGRFGAKVTMDNSPQFDAPDQFDQRRIRLADIDGSGVTDIIYLKGDGIYIYLNESGNRWADAEKLKSFPKIDNLSSVIAVDLLGNGTACLVWSSPLPAANGKPLRYIDLMGGQKPHLLIKTVNNLGAETHVQYAPSTKFYLADKEAGKPWITRIPFPVHVVERVETFDRISRNLFVTRYAYHHGYFDGEEREFRGFGMVEQWDTERFMEAAPKYEIGRLATAIIEGTRQFSFRPIIDIKPSLHPGGGWFYFFEGISTGFPEADVLLLEDAGEQAAGAIWDGTPEAETTTFYDTVPAYAINIEAASHVPPVHTKTWFHTGVYLGREHVSDFFAGIGPGEGEYYREPALRGDANDLAARTLLLEDTILPDALTVEEEREACRALKGAILRREVYALDGTDKEEHPYTVTEQNFTIKCLQARGDNRHAVFFTHPREAINYHYERNPVDPRISHALTLEVDQYGNVLKEVTIGYGRRKMIREVDNEDKVIEQENPAKKELDLDDWKKQTRILVTYTENQVTNAIDLPLDDPEYDPDNYRTPLPCKTKTYELTGYTPTGVAGRFQADDFVEPDPNDPEGEEINYEDDPTSGKQRRLIENLRTLYRKDDLTGFLELGKLEPLAVPGESYKLAFTPGLITQVFQRGGQSLLANRADVLAVDLSVNVTDDRGGYIDLDNDDHWWIPSGRVFLSPNSGDTAALELPYARQHFFLPHRYRDPFHTNAVSTESFVTYDAYDLLVEETRDALDNRVTSDNDYRVLQPMLLTDTNRNRAAVAFDTLGMVVGTAVMGKTEEDLGDSLAGFTADLSDSVILDHLANPMADPHSILQHATTRLVYDLFAYQRTKDQPDPQPAVVYTLARETHEADLAAGQISKIQHSFSYSDGFGREIQKKIQAEPGPVPRRDPVSGDIITVNGYPEMTPDNVNPRWVGSGWIIFNNKGKPVRQYEPFFTDTHGFEFDIRIGVSPVLFYDPVERVVATLRPNHTYKKVIFDPWHQETWDVNDTVLQIDPKEDLDVGGFFSRLPDKEYLPTWYDLRTNPGYALIRWPDNDPATGNPLQENALIRQREKAAAEKASAHAKTPTTAFFDTLGRPFLTIADNGTAGKYETRVVLDIEGNQREVIDARDRIVMRYDYDMLGNRIYQLSMEAGARWILNDVTGKPIRAWDSRGHIFRTEYDPLRRPLAQYVRGTSEESDPRTLNLDDDILIDKIEYGENQADAERLNLRTRVYRHCDSAGIATNARLDANAEPVEAYDFKGNLLYGMRRLVSDYTAIPDWLQNPPLEDETFESSTRYDALNRPIQAIAPHSSLPHARRNVIQPVYNEANLLERVDVWLERAAEPDNLLDPDNEAPSPVGVANIDYDAKGQRELIEYGNRTRTEYEYDELTFRLTKLQTLRGTTRLQDLSYTYDPVGNISDIRNDAQQTLFFNNAVVEPHAEYTYDALYRLLTATGREHIGQSSQPQTTWKDEFRTNLPHPQDGQAMRRYTERYEYDEVGNFLSLIHQATGGNWRRDYQYNEDSLIKGHDEHGLTITPKNNRLSSTTLHPNGNQPIKEPYSYDAHGNMTSMPHLPLMQWDYRDRLQATSRQVNNGSTPEITYYVYDAAGQRVRKVTEMQNDTLKNERIYLGGFEIYREHNGPSAGSGQAVKLERETLHIMDDKQRIALVETRTLDTMGNDPAPERLIRYQFGNHLGSSSLELDDQAQIISYEEYTPYGSTSYQAVRSQTETPKRYRYTGMERDEETGLNYHGARYYAGWLGLWISCDPKGIVDTLTLYAYVKNNPVRLIDRSGLQGGPASRTFQRIEIAKIKGKSPDEVGVPAAVGVNIESSVGVANLGGGRLIPLGWSFVYFLKGRDALKLRVYGYGGVGVSGGVQAGGGGSVNISPFVAYYKGDVNKMDAKSWTGEFESVGIAGSFGAGPIVGAGVSTFWSGNKIQGDSRDALYISTFEGRWGRPESAGKNRHRVGRWEMGTSISK